MTIWRITNRLTSPGQGGDAFNVFHARRDTTGPDGNRFIQALETFYTSLTTVYPDGAVITIGESIVDVETQEFVESTPAEVTTAGGGFQAPELLQVVIPWRTSVRARRAMGRTFVGPLGSVWNDNTGNPDSASLTKVGDAADALVAESESLGLGAFGVWGFQDPKPRDSPRNPEDPKVLRDFIGRGPLRANGYSFLSSRRD